MANTKNFRQIGRRKGRTEKKKKTSTGKRTIPSIPSKYAHTKSNRTIERYAFGCSSFRFRGEVRAPVPGPGKYRSRLSLNSKSNVSYSKHGYGGGFASKTKRFPQRRFEEEEEKVKKISSSCIEKEQQKTYADTSFNCSARRFQKSAEHKGMPGPGTYFKMDRPRRRGYPTSSFRSHSSRGVDTKHTAKTPAPGQYTIKRMQRYDAKLPSSMFRSSSERLKADSKSMQTPGPGTYNGHLTLASFESKPERPQRKRPMKLAAAHFHKRDIGTEKKKKPVVNVPSSLKNPSESTTTPETTKPTKKTTTKRPVQKKATFRSKPPGPCYYKIKLSTVGKPSFHRNEGKIWV